MCSIPVKGNKYIGSWLDGQFKTDDQFCFPLALLRSNDERLRLLKMTWKELRFSHSVPWFLTL
jgi:hypothetical protein